MAIEFLCQCGEQYNYPDSEAGTMGRCPSCKSVLQVPMPAVIPGGPRASADSADLVRPKPKVSKTRYGNGLEQGRNLIVGLVLLGLGTVGYLSAYSIYMDQQKIARKVPPSSRMPVVPKKSALSPTQFSVAPGSLSEMATATPAAPTSPPPKLTTDPTPSTSMAPSTAPANTKPAESTSGSKVLTTDQIIAKVEPSVAVIRGFDVQGAGFVVAPGLIATNAHLIRRSFPNTLKVSFPAAPKGRQGPFPVEVLHFDEARNLAILGVTSPTPPIPVASDYALRRGEDVVYIGGPRLDDENERGVISRGMLAADVQFDGRGYYELSGPLTPGQSGGPVVDPLGRVVAVLCCKGPGEGTGLCIPGSDLAEAVAVAQAREPARVTEARRRHETSVRLASAVVRNGNGLAVEGRVDKILADFIKRTKPATWLASVDASAFQLESSPSVDPIRDRFKRVRPYYVDGDMSIAAAAIQSVGKVRDAGMSASCDDFLEAAATWAPEAVLKSSRTRSILTFGEAYVGLRVNRRLGHAEALARMRDDPNSLPPGLVGPAPATSKGNGPDSAPAKLEVALRLEYEGKTDEALAAFRSILENFPKTPQSGIAQSHINTLKPKKTPPPAPSSGRTVPRG